MKEGKKSKRIKSNNTNSYKSKNLNTNVVLYTNNWSTERVTATFVYDDILYEFVGKNMSKDEINKLAEKKGFGTILK